MSTSSPTTSRVCVGPISGVIFFFSPSLSKVLYPVQGDFIRAAPCFLSCWQGDLPGPTEGGRGCGCARAATAGNELWHLKPWKTRSARGRDGCLASRRSDCLRGFAGSPMMRLEGCPDGRAPPCFPPGTLRRAPCRTAAGLCPLVSPLCLQTPTPHHPKASQVGWEGSGQPGVDPGCVCTIPELSPRLSCLGVGFFSSCFF